MKKLPKCLQYFLREKPDHFLLKFRDDYWFKPLKNTMYKIDGKCIYAEDNTPIFAGDDTMFYNPKTMSYENLHFNERNYSDRHSLSDEKSYLVGLDEYVSEDFEDFSNWLCFNLSKYLQDKYSLELKLVENEYGGLLIDFQGVVKRLQVFKDFENNKESYLFDDNKGKEFKFFDAQSLYSFVNQLREEMKGIKIGSKYSEIYDKVMSGEMSKEDFLKVIV